MSIPEPAKELDGHCSVIVDNVLYVLSSSGFQSLPLKKKAEWSKEPTGQLVSGAACVKVGDDSNAQLWVIGGETDDSSYSGLQRYDFNSKTWETLPIAVPVLQGRTNHSAAWLQDSSSIVSYAGSQPIAPSTLSSQTFLISTVEPYIVNSYISYSPTANLPILQPFNTSHAVLAGGSDLNTQIWTFEPTMGFQPMELYLTEPLPPAARGIVLDGSQGSKVLEVYDTSASPNTVSQVVLLGEYGVPAYTGQTVGTPPSRRKRKRDLSINNWPAYNDTNAPTATRSDSSVAQGFRVSVIAGGNEKDPVAIFNNNDNSWIDAADFFDSKQVKQQPLKPTTSSATHTTATTSSTASASTTAAAGSGDDGAAHDRMVRTLGITLGVLCGIAAIFILVLLYLRWRKMKKRKAEGYLDEKDQDGARMSFADRGASFMKEAGGSINNLPPPKGFGASQNNSHSSLAIITGRFAKRNTNGHQANASYDSTTRLVKDKNGAAIISEPVEMVNLDEKKKMVEQRRPSMTPREEPKVPPAHYGPNLTAQDAKDATNRRKRSSGWSKYFATSQPTGPNGVSHLPSAYGNKQNTYSDASAYSNDRGVSQPSQIPSSVLVPPLDLDFMKGSDGQRLSHVASGSPAFNDSREDLASRGSLAPEGQRGLIVDPSRPRSQSETISSYNRSTMSSTMTTSEYYDNSGATPWTPTSTSFKDHLNSRAPSSVYDTTERVPSRGKSSNFFPGSGTSYRPRSKPTKMSHTGAPSSDWASPKNNPPLKPPVRPAEERDSTVTVFPTGLETDNYPGKNIQPPKITRPWATGTAEDRDSTLTQFPGVPSAYYPGKDRLQQQAKPVNSDLGWLNLNDSQTRL